MGLLTTHKRRTNLCDHKNSIKFLLEGKLLQTELIKSGTSVLQEILIFSDASILKCLKTRHICNFLKNDFLNSFFN